MPIDEKAEIPMEHEAKKAVEAEFREAIRKKVEEAVLSMTPEQIVRWSAFVYSEQLGRTFAKVLESLDKEEAAEILREVLSVVLTRQEFVDAFARAAVHYIKYSSHYRQIMGNVLKEAVVRAMQSEEAQRLIQPALEEAVRSKTFRERLAEELAPLIAKRLKSDSEFIDRLYQGVKETITARSVARHLQLDEVVRQIRRMAASDEELHKQLYEKIKPLIEEQLQHYADYLAAEVARELKRRARQD